MSDWTLQDDYYYRPRSKGITAAGTAVASVNGTAYLFGGGQGNVWTISHADVDNDHAASVIDMHSSDLVWQHTPPGISTDDGFFVVGTAHENDTSVSIHLFNTSANAWSPIDAAPPTTTNTSSIENTRPGARWHHAAVLVDHQKMFVYGGDNKTHAMGDFWSYTLASRVWTPIAMDAPFSRCGASHTLLANGWLVFLGGFECTPRQPLPSPRPLVDMTAALIYDTHENRFFKQPLGGQMPVARAYHTAIQGSDDRIFILGGQDGAAPPFQVYVSSQGQLQDMVAILNTRTWAWQSVPGTHSSAQPLPQSMASAWTLDDKMLVFGLGIMYQTADDALYVLDTSALTWQALDQPVAVEEATTFSKTRFILHVVFGVIGGLCFLALIVIMVRLGRQCIDVVKHWVQTAKKTVWRPRIGEPAWAETIRLVLLVISMGFFAFLISLLVNQVINSPIIDQISYLDNPSMAIDAPDIRFCTNDSQTVIRCATDIGMQCSEFVLPVPASVRSKQRCHLFRAPSNRFQLGRTNDRTVGNGSFLKFDYYFGQPAGMEVALYHPLHDPNLVAYNLTDPHGAGDDFTWKDAMEEATFVVSDRKGVLTKNVHHLNSRVVTSGSYELIHHITLRDTLWNYVGFSPQVALNYEIDSMVLPETSTSQYSSEPAPLGSFHLYPMHYEKKVLHEQRAFALVNATGVFGGLFGLFVSFQVVIFGYRPRSPWGIVHRWSVGHMRSSLLHELHKKFIPQSLNVPIISPLRDETRENKSTIASTVPRTRTKSAATLPSPLLPTTTLPTSPIDPPSAPSLEPLATPVPVVGHLFSDEPESYVDFDAERLTRMEDRMEMLEKLFQAYYINDEIFSALETALHYEATRPPPPTSTPADRGTRSSLRLRLPFRRK